MKKVISLVLTIIFIFYVNADLFNIFAEDLESLGFSEISFYKNISYSKYYDFYSDYNKPESEIIIDAMDYKNIENGDFLSEIYNDRYCLICPEKGCISYEIDVPESGIYCLEINYYPIPSNSPSIEFSMMIDNDIPYDTASRLNLNKIWVNESDDITDRHGNQIRPSQIQRGRWCNSYLNDTDGLFSEPLIFYLEEGIHKISFDFKRADIAIEKFIFNQPEKLKSYDDYFNSIDTEISVENTPDNLIKIEGENAIFKSDSILYPTYDNSDYLVSPSSPDKVLYNTIGDGNWNNAFQSISWKIPKEEIKTGWYKIGIKSRQDEMRGFYSSRRIYIDGKVPFEEFNNLNFPYSSDWNVISPENYIYLSSDDDHFITMEAIPSEISEYLCQLDDVLVSVNDYYRKILMITGTNPDKYTDYYVHEKIPELISEFSRISEELKDIQKNIENISSSFGTEASVIERMTDILDKSVKKPLKIPQYLSEIYDNISVLSSWSRQCRKQPLEIDYIELCTLNQDFSDIDKSFFKSLSFGFRSFISSFFIDYSTISDITGDEAIEVWVNAGREQAQVIRDMTEMQFMQEYPDIPVSVNLVSSGIVEASMTGHQPDVALFLGGEFPVNLASRGILEDLKSFDDYEDIKKRFQKNAFVNYEFNNGCYGLPVSQNWAVMFYREDILNSLGFENPPETWQELIDMLPAIQRNYMSVGLVLPSNNISPATETGHTFACLMLQQDMNYYNQELTESVLDCEQAVSAFKQWTDFYTDYSFMQSYDAFSRFRTGEYPIIIADYTFFNQLKALAPEINNLWNFTSILGTERDDGTISHAVNSNGTCAVIFNKDKNQDEKRKYKAWEYIKWFTEADVQSEYARRIEGLMGITERFDTANTEALKNLSWSSEELEKLLKQREELSEIPVIPSSYAVTRNIMNAFRETVNNGENARNMIIWYNQDINQEIRRKRKN
ncbi:MAG: extracellular solute-binding protein [Oscillospiraceae bacterium]|nr:extracellular solute-binding protein [Oscillospiraceae bacterium]